MTLLWSRIGKGPWIIKVLQEFKRKQLPVFGVGQESFNRKWGREMGIKVSVWSAEVREGIPAKTEGWEYEGARYGSRVISTHGGALKTTVNDLVNGVPQAVRRLAWYAWHRALRCTGDWARRLCRVRGKGQEKSTPVTLKRSTSRELGAGCLCYAEGKERWRKGGAREIHRRGLSRVAEAMNFILDMLIWAWMAYPAGDIQQEVENIPQGKVEL